MSILSKIVYTKEIEIEALKARTSTKELSQMIAPLPPPLPFKQAIGKPSISLIAEIKDRSPSVKRFQERLNPLQTAKVYEAAGAKAISVLTDQTFFGGSMERLATIRKISHLPLLRKDFILDPIQLYEARAYGADAVLLIAGLLTLSQLTQFLDVARTLCLQCLVEVHTQEELATVLRTPTEILGINNRDLTTFETNLETTFSLVKAIPPERKKELVVVSESGIAAREQIQALQQSGVNAVLIGEALLKSPDIETTIKELFS